MTDFFNLNCFCTWISQSNLLLKIVFLPKNCYHKIISIKKKLKVHTFVVGGIFQLLDDKLAVIGDMTTRFSGFTIGSIRN